MACGDIGCLIVQNLAAHKTEGFDSTGFRIPRSDKLYTPLTPKSVVSSLRPTHMF